MSAQPCTPRKALPTLPTVAVKLLNLIADADAGVREIGGAIRLDPSLTGKVIRAANSARYGIGRPVAEVDRAIVLLGKRTVSTLALTFSLSDAINSDKQRAQYYQHYWMESVIQGLAAEILAESACPERKSEFFCAGLLQDLGRLYLLQEFPDRYTSIMDEAVEGDVLLTELEREAFGYDHVELTSGMLSDWNFPQQVIFAASSHHKYLDEISGDATEPLTLEMGLYIAGLVGEYFCHHGRGISHVKLEEALARCQGSLPAAHELTDAVHQRLAELADMFNIDPNHIPTASEMMTEAMDQVARIALSMHDDEPSESVSVELIRENNRLRQRLEEVVKRFQVDHLTGVYTREVLVDRLNQQILQAGTRSGFVGLLFIDIDRFKQINDTHGHLAGDYVLRQVGQAISSRVRGNDLAARYGGEEFAIVVAEPDLQTVHTVAERIRQAIEDLHVVYDKKVIPVTVSIGAALIGPIVDTDGMETMLLATADAAMYRAKHEGRNRVVVSTGGDIPRAPVIRSLVFDDPKISEETLVAAD